ncbi:sulfite oxidase heme-binding subunit YedZ [Marinomonas balearica]|uniref:Protein-methionine-sulfoxide reductase heme-binding subunit MsrQ n=1 Tax=Marinomonas balearica TaxID=491947 RepID=A0A4R6MDQ9_9GAMM|nr:protein-methionine-sulfoxide reductase heme-binding subunit MsrQ [Marinomonas balearica]TDO98339.1 sulfoxide reductase heme-binding subunit YedZ [Marinomonas balearica]
MTFYDHPYKKYAFVLFSLPMIWIVSSLLSGRYFPDPAEPVMTLTGIWAVVFLVFTLLMTPLVKVSRFKWISRFRRFIGLTVFWYSSAHVCGYLVLHAGFSWVWIKEDLLKRPYMYVGFIAVVILSVLALTSFKFAIKKLRKNWKPLHRTVYIAVLLVILHLWWQVKSDISVALYSSLALVPFLMYRLNASYFPTLHTRIKETITKIKKTEKSACVKKSGR